MSEVGHGPSPLEALESKHSFAVVEGVVEEEALDKRAEQGEDADGAKDGRSLHEVKRALRQNFRATGVIDDVTVRQQ